MQPDIVGLVQQPASDAPPPSPPRGAASVRILEGTRHGVPCRWLLAEAQSGVATGELLRALIETADTQPRVRFVARAAGERTGEGFDPNRVTHVMPVGIAAPPEEAGEVDRWYEEEHNGLLLRCPNWLRVRRYTVDEIDGAGWSRLALHDLASADVLSSPEVRAAMSTPWRDRLVERPWFLAEGRDPLVVRV